MNDQEKKDRTRNILIVAAIGVGTLIVLRKFANARALANAADINEINLGITKFQLQSMIENPNWTIVWDRGNESIRLQRLQEAI